ncbi:hypothetical protein GCM10010080_05410 [Thermomonas carbonis]|nr:hypothetical protein GCM10010080_05410 [Thermomonas carbonis]
MILLIPKPPLQDRQARRGRVVLAHADPRMVAVPMGDHRARHRSPRIDMEIAGRAIQAFGAEDDKVWHWSKDGGARVQAKR